MCYPAEGDDRADRHLRRLDQHAIDEQFHQRPATREGVVVEALGDRGAAGVELGRHGGDLRGVVEAGDALLLLVREIGKARLQRLHTGPRLLQGDRFCRVGVDEPLALPLEGPGAGPEVVPARCTASVRIAGLADQRSRSRGVGARYIRSRTCPTPNSQCANALAMSAMSPPHAIAPTTARSIPDGHVVFIGASV